MADLPSETPAAAKPEQTELVLDGHRQLEVSDLLADEVVVGGSSGDLDSGAKGVGGTTPTGSMTPPEEDVGLGGGSGESAERLPTPAPQFLHPRPMSPIVRAASTGFDDVSTTTTVGGATPSLGMFSAAGSMIDIQPLNADTSSQSLTSTPNTSVNVISDAPIPFGASTGPDLFASFPTSTPPPVQTNQTAFSIPSAVTQPSAATPQPPATPQFQKIEQQPSFANFPPPIPPPPTTSTQPHFTATFPQPQPTTQTQSSTRPAMTVHIPALLDARHLSLPTRRLTDPTIFHDIPTTDPVADLITKHFPPYDPTARPTISLNSLSLDPPQDPTSLLAQTHSFRSLAQHTRQKLTACHPANVDQINRLWTLRVHALIKLKLVDMAIAELDRIGSTFFDASSAQNPNLKFETYPDIWADKTGCIVSWELRLIWAKLPSYKSLHQDSINKLYALLYECRRNAGKAASNSADKNLWTDRATHVTLAIATSLLELRDYRLVTSLLTSLSHSRPKDVDLLSALGRVHLQSGDLGSAERVFRDVESILGVSADESLLRVGDEYSDGTSPVSGGVLKSDVKERAEVVYANAAYWHLAGGRANISAAYLTHVLTLAPTTHLATFNNLSVATLYTGNARQAVSVLESGVVEVGNRKEGGGGGGARRQAMSVGDVVGNLWTMVELGERSGERKRRVVREVVGRWGGDEAGVVEAVKV
ncbi:hypothetical protein HDV00_008023 [Rhizophlyctis rosea]|nr:hypothetical protein HDV00_008023 [Rhizophlyctis rosea]